MSDLQGDPILKAYTLWVIRLLKDKSPKLPPDDNGKSYADWECPYIKAFKDKKENQAYLRSGRESNFLSILLL